MSIISSEINVIIQCILAQQIHIECAKISSSALFFIFCRVFITIIVRRAKTDIQTIGRLELQPFTKINSQIHTCQTLHGLTPTRSIGHHTTGIIIG